MADLLLVILSRGSSVTRRDGIICLSGPIPWLGAGLQWVKNPKSYLETARQKYGDNFMVHMWGNLFFFVFSPEGLKKLYQVPEEEASFPRATRNFLGLKVPAELLDNFLVVEAGWRDVFTHAMKRQLLDRYVVNANKTITEFIDQLPATEGRFELYPFFRKVIHKFGFRCWAGEEAANEYLPQFKDHFDKIDPEQAFVNPLGLLWTIVTGKRAEKAALEAIVQVMESIWSARQAKAVRVEDLFTTLVESLPSILPDKAPAEIHRIAVYLMIGLHLASQTNLSSAATWTIINLLEHLDQLDAVTAKNAELRAKNPDYLQSLEVLGEMEQLEKVIYETIRIAQQSLTLRLVRKPLEFTDATILIEPLVGGQVMESARRCIHSSPLVALPDTPGSYFATLLNVMNCTEPAVPPAGCPASQFRPDRFKKSKLDGCPAGYKYVVSTFGHLRHACPGERFTLNAFKVFVGQLFSRLELTPEWREVRVPQTQMGAVARTDRPVWVHYRKK